MAVSHMVAGMRIHPVARGKGGGKVPKWMLRGVGGTGVGEEAKLHTTYLHFVDDLPSVLDA